MKIVNEFYFSIIPEWITEANISDSAVRVYSALCRFADKDNGSCYPSHQTIGKRCNKSVSAVKRALKELEKIGAIKIEPRFIDDKGQTSNLYTVKYLPITNELEGQVKNELDPSSNSDYKLKSINDSHNSKQLAKQDKFKIKMTLMEHIGYKPTTQSEKNNLSRTVKELYEANATVQEIVDRINVYKKDWNKVALTHEALRNNWAKLGEMVDKNKPITPRDCKIEGHKWINLGDCNQCQFCKILDIDEKVSEEE